MPFGKYLERENGRCRGHPRTHCAMLDSFLRGERGPFNSSRSAKTPPGSGAFVFRPILSYLLVWRSSEHVSFRWCNPLKARLFPSIVHVWPCFLRGATTVVIASNGGRARIARILRQRLIADHVRHPPRSAVAARATGHVEGREDRWGIVGLFGRRVARTLPRPYRARPVTAVRTWRRPAN
jgi:hypothetical protein